MLRGNKDKFVKLPLTYNGEHEIILFGNNKCGA